MRLKRLDIIGFKSFADRTQIVFDKGVTAVVGPNGCGKSNISDSIRWVLGERSAKLLRGSKMEDVIFSGTQFRKPTSLAEVSLTIDNEDRGLPIDFNEVTITRKLYRSGESEYLINKTICRRKDVQDLILDTGIGSSSYSMIEQGRIDYILSADADERRFLIEEAAGISKYKVKKDEAVRKLERTEENRLRLNDIIQEVHKNIQYAEKQAKRAEKYKEHFDELKKLELKKAFYDLDQVKEKKESLHQQKSELSDEMTSLESNISSVRQIQEAVSKTLRGILDRFANEDEKRHRLQSKIDQTSQQLQFHQEKRMEMATRAGEIQQEKKQLEDRITVGKSEILSKTTEVQSLKMEKERARETLLDSERKMEGIDAEVSELRELNERLRKECDEATSKTSLLRNGFHRLEAFLHHNQDQKIKRSTDIDKILQEKAEIENSQSKNAQDLQATIKSLESTEATLGQLHEKQLSTDKDLRTTELLSKETDRSIHEQETRLKMLCHLQNDSKASRDDLLDESLGITKDVLKDVEEFVSVNSGFEWALELALAQITHSLVISSKEKRSAILERILEKKIPSLSLLLQDAELVATVAQLPRPDFDFIECALIDVMTIQGDATHLFTPWTANTYILRKDQAQVHLEELLKYSDHYCFLSPEGIVLGPNYAINVRRGETLDVSSIFQRKREIEHLNSKIPSLQDMLVAHQENISHLQQQLKELRDQIKASEEDQLNFRVQRESLEAVQSNSRNRLTGLMQSIEAHQNDALDSAADEEKAKSQLVSLSEELSVAESIEAQTRSRFESLTGKRDMLDARKTEALNLLARNKATYENLDERNRLLEESLSYLLEHEKTDLERIESLSKEAERIVQRNRELIAEDEVLAAEKNQNENSRRESEIALELIRKEKIQAEEELSEAQQKLESLQSKQHQQQELFHKSEIQFMELEYQSKQIHERLQQTYHLQLSEFNPEEYVVEEPLTEMIDRIDKLRKRVDSIGTVNLLAIEEYDELKERYDFLTKQQDDLEEARNALMETIRKINRTTKALFEETFSSVQEAFQDYYSQLFKGGHAQLVLVDETNPLESGIDIVVRPPGKKLQHISLLSGGEKALTAIALLFSLFKIKPSPFCVLDEVDAPLDEANVDRFLTVLRTFLKLSQFIIVTHNRKTIAMGDSLYGVTMEEAGVSKLVSVKVSHDDGAVEKTLLQENKAQPVVGASAHPLESEEVQTSATETLID